MSTLGRWEVSRIRTGNISLPYHAHFDHRHLWIRGNALAIGFRENLERVEVLGFDNFVRPGSELNRLALQKLGIIVRHA